MVCINLSGASAGAACLSSTVFAAPAMRKWATRKVWQARQLSSPIAGSEPLGQRQQPVEVVCCPIFQACARGHLNFVTA